MSPKDKEHKLCKQDVVYYIPCREPSCNACYIGETCRVLGERIKDHANDSNSALKRHHLDTNHPIVNPEDDNIKIVGSESNAFKRKVKEALFIKVNNPSLNQNIGKFNIPPIYDQLLKNGGGGKLLLSSRFQ